MMNQVGNTDTITQLQLDPNSLEKRQIVDASQGHASSYHPSTTVSEAVSWNMHRADNHSTENGMFSNSSYHHVQQTEPHLRNAQDGLNAASAVYPPSSLGAASVPQQYNGYTTYPSSNDPYSYGNTGYPGYYSGYQQQSNHSYSQPIGANQNTGAPYQPLSSFQNTGSYAGPASYPSTYYNPGDYQTSGGHSSGYNNQNNLWSEGNYANYTHQYANYTPDSNGAYSSSTAAATSLQYQQHYKQWADYYSQTEVSCAPGTENMSVTSTSNLACPIPGVTSSYSTSASHPPQPSISSWGSENSSALPSVQPGAAISDTHDGYWKHGAPSFQNHHVSTVQPDFQKHLDTKPSYDSFQDQQKTACPQGSNLQYPTAHKVSHSYQSPLPTIASLDTRRVNKLQIPTNPRIASNLALGLPKIDKDSSATGGAAKPAYISVSVPKPSDKVLSHDGTDAILKPGMFPPSVRGYVERAFTRCKDETQKAACQTVLKEVIIKATADGTLYTRDWDIEPLFPLPDADAVNNNIESSISVSLPKPKRSPSRRSKSRWEPVADEKLIDKPASINHETVKYGGWVSFNERTERDKKFPSGKPDIKEDGLSSTKFPLIEQRTASKSAQRPVKRQRFGDVLNSAENGDASSDSDKEQSLTAYYSSAITLANSPEERKRRENRSKRFEKGHGHRAETNHFRPKNFGAGSLYTRRASALVLSKNFEEGGSRAVEDIDWDALTVKGTCQEIEKRYLRLTSAPDPSTVRPEEVLEKALLMVQNSHKNYLYKCDQLKSIRQDLTVQRIRNELTVKVYETHARLAIEAGDLPEYNQCQSQLKTLYAEGIEGCDMEFAAYNLLCAILHSSNNRDLLSSMSRLSDEARKDEVVKHALAVRAAVTSGNYVLFFRLYKTAPNLNTCLMDLCVEKMRYEAVRCMSRSYRPTVPVSYIAQVLGFTSASPTSEGSDLKEVDKSDECVEWLKAHGACLITDNTGEMQLDAKASSSSLYRPEPEDAVAHGDTSLAVNDFLTRASS